MRRTRSSWALGMGVGIGLMAAPALAEPWSGEAELGVLASRGNTDSTNGNARLQLAYETARWRHEGRLQAFYSAEEDDTTGERYVAGYRSNYSLTDRQYVFGRLRFEKDRFGGVQERYSETLGYGHEVLQGPTHFWHLEGGAGARQTRYTDDSSQENEVIGFFGTEYEWQFSDTASLSEEVLVESGADNTYVESVTALTAQLIGELALQLSFTVKHNTDVPAGSENTDTFTALSLIYGW